MRVNEFDMSDSLYYGSDHHWLLVDEERCSAELTDCAQKQAHETVFIELPTAGADISAARIMRSLESMKSVSDIFSPISGEILQNNENVKQTPSIINRPLRQWMARESKSIKLEE